MNNYFDECIKLSKISYDNNDVPVGAVVVINNEIIGRGFNNRFNSKDVTDHAEIVAIREAARKIGDWRLSDCDLYVTLKPCAMCSEVIKESRIKNVYYLLDKDVSKKGYSKTKFCLEKDSYQQLILNYSKLLSDFFKENLKR